MWKIKADGENSDFAKLGSQFAFFANVAMGHSKLRKNSVNLLHCFFALDLRRGSAFPHRPLQSFPVFLSPFCVRGNLLHRYVITTVLRWISASQIWAFGCVFVER